MAFYLFKMEGCGEQPLKPVGRARGRRTVAVVGPRKPGLGSSELCSQVKVKLFLSTPLRHVRKWIYSSTHS